ncbi:MAG: peptidoglycan DD-metalloendopeptidase family protein [Candidatus Schekmanbacteria bacterium]|nr:peptidoglycan DD-metalloendopeptidase family protein [Candidatus Schekmanbacteria bacterium]
MRLLKSRLKITAVIVLFFLFPVYAFAAEKKTETPKNPEEIKKELADEETKLQSLSKKRSGLEGEIKNITTLLRKKEKELAKYKTEYVKLTSMNRELSDNLQKEESNVRELKDYISNRVKFVYMRGKDYPLKVIYNSKGYLNFVNNVMTVKIISSRELKDFNRVNEQVMSLNKLQNSLTLSLAKTKEVYDKETALGKELADKKREKNKLITMLRSQEYLSGKKIAGLKKQVSELGTLVQEVDMRSEENVQATANDSKVNELFPDNRKLLGWPVKGELPAKRIISGGNSPALRGIMISVSKGDVVQSIFGGKISFAGPFKEYGNLVIVDHGDGYYSVYGFNGNIFVKEGQNIFTGKILGKINLDTGGSGKLYFEINHRGEPQNPIEWLHP